MTDILSRIVAREDTARVVDLRRRVRAAMERPPVPWTCPQAIASQYMGDPLPVRKARAIALKLSVMPTDLWAGQLFAGSMTLEARALHYEHGFPDYVTPAERQRRRARALASARCSATSCRTMGGCSRVGLRGIMEDVARRGCPAPRRRRPPRSAPFSTRSMIVLQAVIDYAAAARRRTAARGAACYDCGAATLDRAAELAQMAVNLRQVPAARRRPFGRRCSPSGCCT
jgi:hypothetical protein